MGQVKGGINGRRYAAKGIFGQLSSVVCELDIVITMQAFF